jgi:hypothetical protein
LSTKSESNESRGILVTEPVIVAVIAATMTQTIEASMIFIRKLSGVVRGFSESSCDMRNLLSGNGSTLAGRAERRCQFKRELVKSSGASFPGKAKLKKRGFLQLAVHGEYPLESTPTNRPGEDQKALQYKTGRVPSYESTLRKT